jgi:hypothetical protein
LPDKTAPNVAFEYGGDRNGDDSLKEIEIEEKQQLFDSTITTPLARFSNINIAITPCPCARDTYILLLITKSHILDI